MDGYRLFRGILLYTGQWTGTNIRRNTDGTITTRPGLFKLNVTGVPTGKVLGYGRTQYPGQTGWFVVGTTVYGFDNDAGGAVFTYTGALAGTPTSTVAGIQSGPSNLYLTAQGAGTYVVDLAAKTVTQINRADATHVPGAKCVGLYNERLVLANLDTTDNANRVMFSNPYAPGGTPQFQFAASDTYFDTGDAWDVNFLGTQRTHLLIGKQTGWWVYQGEPGLNAVLRQQLVTDGPKEPLHAAILETGLVWYVPLFTDCPAEFTGSAMQQLRHLRFAGQHYVQSTFPPSFGVSAMAQPTDVFMLAGHANTGGTDRAAELHNGAWAYHTFGVTTSGFLASFGNSGVCMCDGGAVGVAANFYIYPSELDRPVVSGDLYGSFGDGSTTMPVSTVTLPEWESRDGSEVVVKSVIVGFKKWNTGSAQSNHMDVQVVSTRQWRKAGDSNGGQTSVTRTWDEAPSATSSPGQYQEYSFNVGDQGSGNGFRLVLSNLRGVSIQKIQVILDIGQTRP